MPEDKHASHECRTEGRCLDLWFADEPVRLVRTRLTCPDLYDVLPVRGDPVQEIEASLGGVERGFAPTKSVAAMCIFFLKCAACARERAKAGAASEPSLSGTRPGAAASLNDALAKPRERGWPGAIFGFDRQGGETLVALATRRNTSFSPAYGGMISIHLNESLLPASSIHVYRGERKVDAPAELWNIAGAIWRRCWPDEYNEWVKGQRVKRPGRSAQQVASTVATGTAPRGEAGRARQRHPMGAPQIPRLLRPHWMSFDGFIRQRVSGFAGRRFLSDAVDNVLGNRDVRSGYVIVEGEPGIGKSAWLSWLVKTRKYPVHHFNIVSQGINTTKQFLGNVCARLIHSYRLPHESLPEGFYADGSFLNTLLQETSNALAPARTLILAVDALDEAQEPAGLPAANILFLPPCLPENVFVVATTRPGWTRHLRVERVRVVKLCADSRENLEDAQQHVMSRLEHAAMRSWLERRSIPPDKFVSEMVRKSEGNFMYLHYVLPEIERGGYRDLNLDEIPDGLQNYYEDHWRRMGMTSRPLPRPKIEIVYILSALFDPISRALLSEFSGYSETDVQDVLDEWDQFLDHPTINGSVRHALYHTSFRDFLHRKDIVVAAGIDLRNINARIAGILRKELDD